MQTLIDTDEELAEYTEALFSLTAKAERSPEDEEAKPAEVLRFLLDQNGLLQRDIAGEMGWESIVSLVLAGSGS